MGSQASKTSGDEAMPDDMKANGSSQRMRQRELPPDGDESSEFMSADEDEDEDEEGGVGIMGMNGAIRGTEDEIKMSSDSEDEEEEVDVGGLDGTDETSLQRTTTDANTDLSAEDAWWAGFSSRTDETVARIMQSYGSQPSRSQEVAQDQDDGNEEEQEEENTLVVAQPDEDETQVVQDSMVLDSEQSPAMIGVLDQDSGHGSMADSEVGMLDADMETDDQEVHTAPETPSDWQPTNESQQDRIDAAEETVRRIQAERNRNGANAAEQVETPDAMEIEGHNAGTDMSSVKPAVVKPPTSQDQDEQSQKQKQTKRRPSIKEKKERKWRREQQKLGLAIQKSNNGDIREDPASTTLEAGGPKKELISAEQYNSHTENMQYRAKSNEGLKEESIDDRGMGGGGARVGMEGESKKRDGVKAEEEKRLQDHRETRNAEKRRVRREKRRAEREAAGRPKFNGHIEGKPKAEKNIQKKQRMKEGRQADPNTVEGAKAAFREERKRKKKERRRAEIAAREGGVGVGGQGAGGEGLPVKA